jgi:ATP-dependent Zn protease
MRNDGLIEEEPDERLATRRQRIAYHEAGHAVVVLRLGYKLKDVTIKPNGRAEGMTNYEKRGGLVSDGIKIILAGSLAESLFDGKVSLKTDGSGNDWRAIRKWYPEFCARDVREIGEETKLLVQRHREAIARVARALLERETLTGDDVKRLADGGLQ